jgi:uncharacterized protein
MLLRMTSGIEGVRQLLRSMRAHLHLGAYVFGTLPRTIRGIPETAIASFREAEGISVIMEEGAAGKLGVTTQLRAAWITLTVPTSLEVVGLTATVVQALSAAGISCNVMAASYRDHLFVPYKRAAEAMALIDKLCTEASIVASAAPKAETKTT